MTSAVTNQAVHPQRAQNPNPSAFLTIEGLPVTIEMKWPFGVSSSGSDAYILHGDMRLLGHEDLHALVSIQLSQTFKEALPSLDRKDSESAVVSAIRKELDRKQLELLVQSKLQPVPISSRHYNIKNQKLIFLKTTDEQMADFIRRKVYWLSHKLGGGGKVWLADPYDAEYLGTTAEYIMEAAQKLAGEGWIKADDEFATATPKLVQAGSEIEAVSATALKTLKAKHAYEAGRPH